MIQLPKIRSYLSDIKSYLLGHPSEEIVDKKERMFQTYLIVIGLLFTCNRIPDPEVQEILTRFFYFFF